MNPVVDLAIIGGGINGAGIAADAAGRGLSVYLCEAKDFASATSSASSKLIHGGLRYLEHYEFRLVREALSERETLMHKAPHLIKPMRFILPHRPHLRPAWMIRSGLFLYDNIGGREELPKSKGYKFTPENTPFNESINQGFEYSDCTVDDSRLVVANVQFAAEKGAVIDNHTRCEKAFREGDHWVINTYDTLNDEHKTIRARALINASGPWAQSFIEQQLKQKSPRSIRLIKGSHIIVPKQEIGEKAFILQNEDKRIVFVIPYLDEYTLIGTTDKAFEGDVRNIAIDQEETDYLLKVYNDHFKTPIKTEDIIAAYSGARPLCDDESDDPSAMTRDYTLEVADEEGQLPLLSIFGGKITTYRRLAESALKLLQPYFPDAQTPWSHTGTLPGGENWVEFQNSVEEKFTWLPKALRQRYVNQFGSRTETLLKGCQNLQDLGEDFGQNLHAIEVDYLMDFEWASCADDVLKRRTKLYLKADKIDIAALDAYINQRLITRAEQRFTA